jgi:putative ABC transport system permease protein
MRMFFDIVGQTLRTLWAHKLRSFLTMFGIAWGVGSLLLLVGVGEGFRSGNRRQLATLGEDIMFITSGVAPAIDGQRSGLRPYQVTYGDYEALRDETTMLRNVAPALARGDIRAISDFGNMAGGVQGVTANFGIIRYIPMRSGRWLNDLDNKDQRHVAVIGTEVVKNLFPGQPALGANILLNGIRFEVIGLIDVIGRGDNVGINSQIYIPIETAFMRFPYPNAEPRSLGYIVYQPRTRQEHEEAKIDVHKVIARRHGFDWRNKDSFNERDTIKSAESVGKIFDAMNMFLGSVGLVTLALGAIGIINIMLVSVSERTPEIGLRKALGATNRTVLVQFFLEGAFLTLFSGVLGILFAAGVMQALAQLPSPPGFDTPRLAPSSAALSVVSLALAGIIAGLYPARKAAALQPVEALRKD